MILLEDAAFLRSIGIPGYFWHTTENILYSIKSGLLKPLKGSYWYHDGYRVQRIRELRYSVSHKNKRYTYSAEFLQKKFGKIAPLDVDFITKI